MDDSEAQKQIQQMVNFILMEAKDKAEEIESKALEDYNIEKLKMVQQMKDKIQQEYIKKRKQEETKRAISRSTTINSTRLKKIAARQEAVGQVEQMAKSKLAEVTKNPQVYGSFLMDALVQAALKLLEENVQVSCKEADVALVQQILPQAAQKYQAIIKEETGASKSVSFTLSKNRLPASTIGGVVASCQEGSIKIHCTMDARLEMVSHDCKPQIRKGLFV